MGYRDVLLSQAEQLAKAAQNAHAYADGLGRIEERERRLQEIATAAPPPTLYGPDGRPLPGTGNSLPPQGNPPPTPETAGNPRPSPAYAPISTSAGDGGGSGGSGSGGASAGSGGGFAVDDLVRSQGMTQQKPLDWLMGHCKLRTTKVPNPANPNAARDGDLIDRPYFDCSAELATDDAFFWDPRFKMPEAYRRLKAVSSGGGGYSVGPGNDSLFPPPIQYGGSSGGGDGSIGGGTGGSGGSGGSPVGPGGNGTPLSGGGAPLTGGKSLQPQTPSPGDLLIRDAIDGLSKTLQGYAERQLDPTMAFRRAPR
jgi:hypothetical protein